MIEKMLKQFNLHQDEAKTFIFLLENGEQNVGNLAKKTGISRTSLYGYIQKLKEIGIVIESQKNGVKIFRACSKEKMEKVFQDKIIELEDGKKMVDKMYEHILKNGPTINPKFQLFEGKDGLKEVLKDMLLYRDIETKAYWPIKSMVEILSDSFFKELNRERIKRNIYTYAIWPEAQRLDIKKNPFLGFGEAFLREIRIAPKDINFSMGYWIYGNKVAFISSSREAFGFIIESRELVKMLSSQFDMMWKVSKHIDGKESDGDEFLREVGRFAQ